MSEAVSNLMKKLTHSQQYIQDKIITLRDQQVMIDRDLAELYQVETRALKQAVKRNIERFPTDFMFELTDNEVDFLVSQSVIPSNDRFLIIDDKQIYHFGASLKDLGKKWFAF